MPGEVGVATRLTRTIALNMPILSSAMDTVTEARLAIAMAQAGGIGVIHRNLEPAEQAEEVRKVKRFESGMVVNPITIAPDATLADALALMTRLASPAFRWSSRAGRQARQAGRHPDQPRRALRRRSAQPVAELMTRKLVTVGEGVDQEEAKRLLHQHRIEKLLVVDDAYRCVGLITVKDIEKATAHPNAAKDAKGRLRVAAATTVGDEGFERAELLIEAGRRLLVVDTAHGHSEQVLEQVAAYRSGRPTRSQIIAGNVATADGAQALIDAGADAIKVGIGPGSICTTRIVAGVGVPQLTAILEAAEAAREGRRAGDRRRRHQIFRRPRQGDRGRRGLRDDRLAARRHRRERRARCSSTRAAPTRPTAAWARSARWRAARPTAISRRTSATSSSWCPKASRARCPTRARSAAILHQLVGGLRAAMGYTGAESIRSFQRNAQFMRITNAGLRESHVHDVTITRESPNYPDGGVSRRRPRRGARRARFLRECAISAQEAALRGGPDERDQSGPMLPFPLAPVWEECARSRRSRMVWRKGAQSTLCGSSRSAAGQAVHAGNHGLAKREPCTGSGGCPQVSRE